jgi:hypothetical protein
MKNNNQKLGMYIGIALLVGAVGFIAYNKFSSKLNVGNTSISTDDTDNATASKWNIKNPFSSNSANQLTASQLSIKTPSIASDLLNSFK